MSAIADRYRNVAAQFTQRVESVPGGAWNNPAPCEGWVARDVVAHLVEWLPAFFFDKWAIEVAIPRVDDDPAGAWAVVNTAIQAALDDPTVATQLRDTPMGPTTFEDAVNNICTGDVLIHTWDLARATGLDEALDPAEMRSSLEGIESMGDEMKQAMADSGHFGARLDVPPDADDQTKVLAFFGRAV